MFLFNGLILISLVLAQAPSIPDAEATLIKAYPKNPLINEIIAFEPVAQHKFNLKAKNSCGNGTMLKETEELIECQMFAPGTSELHLYVCEANDTLCRREVFKIKTQEPKGFGGWVKYYKDNIFNHHDWTIPNKSGVSHKTIAKGFMANDLKTALEKAKKEKKKLFVYFTQISCPPCRLLKEMTFASDEFQALLKDYIPLQIDIDLDIEPDKIKPLAVRGTPTVIIFDKDFNELGRSSQLMSPAVFKTWLEKIPSGALVKNDDKERKSEAKMQKTPAEQIAALKTEPVGTFTFSGEAWMNYVESLTNALLQVQLPKEEAAFTQGAALLGALEPRIKSASVDELQRAYDLNTYYGILEYIYEKQNRPKDAKTMRSRLLALVDSFPKLPGVTETSQLEVIRAENSGNPELKKKVYDELRAKNEDDYSYDFWEASEAMGRGDFPAALIAIDKSLAIAKDRSWQKAFMMKLEILKTLKRRDEALKLIDDVFAKTKLPSDPAMKVHLFIQMLRKEQVALLKGP
jgi:thioredoxin-related protein